MYRLFCISLFILSTPSLSFAMMGGHGMHGTSQKIDIPPFDKSKLPNSTSHPARLFQSICTQCHNLPSPAMHTASEWEQVVPRMINHMRRTMMVHTPDKEEQTSIIEYLKTNAQQAFDPNSDIDLTTTEGQTFKRLCSQCHDLPSPTQHKKNEWNSVLERMNSNMQNMGKPTLTPGETKQILEFLQKNSAN